MDDLDFEVSGKKGFIIVTADNDECIELAFEYSIDVKIVFTLLRDGKNDNSKVIKGSATKQSSGNSRCINTSQKSEFETSRSDHSYVTQPSVKHVSESCSKKAQRSTNLCEGDNDVCSSGDGSGAVQEQPSCSAETMHVDTSACGTSQTVCSSGTVNNARRAADVSEEKQTSPANVMPTETETGRPKRKTRSDYCCEECNKTFSNRFAYVEHSQKHLLEDSASEMSDSDSASGKESDEDSNYSLEMDYSDSNDDTGSDVLIDDDLAIQCEQCDKMFDSETKYERHLKSHNLYKCHICDEVLSNKSDYEDHRAEQHGLETEHLCSICGQSFKSFKEYINHRKTHYINEPKEYKCGFCEEVFENFLAWKKHNNTAKHGIYCKICKEIFQTRSLLHYHLRRKHLKDTDEAGNLLVKTCPDCSFIFWSEAKLQRHRRSHVKNESVWTCDLCQKRFCHLRKLQCHLRFVHDPSVDEEPKHPCEVCGVVLPPLKLKRHMVSHKERVFKCKLCPRSFRLAYGLERHMLSHTKEKPFQCDVCSKCFSQATNMTIHMRTHTKDKPFPCQYCELAFSHKCTLQGHVARKHKLETLEEIAQQKKDCG